jgi:hypothetical protein
MLTAFCGMDVWKPVLPLGVLPLVVPPPIAANALARALSVVVVVVPESTLLPASPLADATEIVFVDVGTAIVD